jgi:competence protein ComEC
MPFYVRTLDLVVLTHPHPDHINGLIEALKRYEVMAVLITGINYKYAGYDEFLEILDEKDIKVFLADGRDFQLDGVMFDMIFPFGSIQGREFENINNSSIVFRLIYGESEFYFSGDAELPVEAQIVAKNIDVYADVLKVAHHGSRTASSDALVDLIHPAYAVISVGTDNSFKHPHKETIDVLTADNVKILRTDLTGTIEFVSDGKTLVGKNF